MGDGLDYTTGRRECADRYEWLAAMAVHIEIRTIVLDLAKRWRAMADEDEAVLSQIMARMRWSILIGGGTACNA
jgi:hypothetical protein